MRDDSHLAVSWRARPGSFVALMSLYESNYLRLRALCGDVARLRGRHVSRVEGDSDLHLAIIEQSPYTTTLTLTYDFEETGPPDPRNGHPAVRLPDLEVRVYADARVAEARFGAREAIDPAWRQLRRQLDRELDQRWAPNMLLNKWLEFCLERGHRIR